MVRALGGHSGFPALGHIENIQNIYREVFILAVLLIRSWGKAEGGKRRFGGRPPKGWVESVVLISFV